MCSRKHDEKTNLPSSVTPDTRSSSVKVSSHPHTHIQTHAWIRRDTQYYTNTRMTAVYHRSTFSPEWALCLLFFMFRLFSWHTMTVRVRLLLLFSVKTKRNMWSFTRAFRAACWSFWGIVSLWFTNMKLCLIVLGHVCIHIRQVSGH